MIECRLLVSVVLCVNSLLHGIGQLMDFAVVRDAIRFVLSKRLLYRRLSCHETCKNPNVFDAQRAACGDVRR